MTVRRFVLTLLCLAAVTAAAQADFYIPLTWTRPTATGTNATFQGWETFSSTTGPNAPQVVPGPAFGGVGNWSPINSGGVANVFDSGAPANGSFITGGVTGNIYSMAGLVNPRAIVPNVTGGTASGWTTLIFQVRAAGNALDMSSALLNGTVAPVSSAIVYTEPLGGFGGFRRDYWFQFQVPGNAASYQFDINAVESSVSLDRFAIDTVWNPAATNQSEAFFELTPGSAVPEPSTWALIGLVGIGAGVVSYRRKRLKLSV